MGLFSKIFGEKEDFFNKSCKASKEKPEQWFYTDAAKKVYINALMEDRLNRMSEHHRNSPQVQDFFRNYLKSLLNINKLLNDGVEVDINTIANHFMIMSELKGVDEFGEIERFDWTGYDNILDSNKNQYLFFIKHLNHAYFGWMLKTISPLFLQLKSAPEDAWLYDKELFRVDGSPSTTFGRIKDKLISLGIDTDEILPIENLWHPESRIRDHENYK